jgi:hypothetical protein
MSKLTVKGNASGTGTVIVEAPNTDTNRTITLPDTSGTLLANGAVSASTTNTITNKVAVVINGTTYYLLASTSGS